MKNLLMVVFILFLLLGVFRQEILDGIKGWRTNDTNETVLATTGEGTTANVTLSYDLFQAQLAEIIGMTSNNGTDTPVATAYVEATKVLTVGGLVPSVTRSLAIHYTAETTDATMRIIGPFLVILIFGGIGYLAYRHGKGR
jgi:hypothetical protein